MTPYIAVMSKNTYSADKTTSSNAGGWWSRLVGEPDTPVVHELYAQMVRHARFPLYYDELAVPDTPEGRFEILAIHLGLAVRHLSSLDDQGRELSQELFDLMVADLDENMRELGVGDLSVGKQVKRLASQFYARLAALTERFAPKDAADGDDGSRQALRSMLETNIYGGKAPSSANIDHLEAIVTKLKEALDENAPEDLKAGRLTLPDPKTLSALG